MTTPKISREVFDKKLLNLLNTTSSIQPRLLELIEFEKQWKDLFKDIIPEFGDNVQIHIADQMLLNTYRYDKYHVIYDDLLSLIENEIQSDSSATHNSAFFLKIMPLSDFLEFEKSLEYLGDIGDQRAFLETIFATEKRNSYLETHKSLFGPKEDVSECWDFLKNNMASIKQELKGLRNLFSHKHQIIIQQRYSTSWQGLEIKKISSDFERFYKIVKDLYLLNTRTAIKGVSADFKTSISNQIDLILFGNIENCINLFTTHFPHNSYWHSRNAFYKSRKFIEKVVVR